MIYDRPVKMEERYACENIYRTGSQGNLRRYDPKENGSLILKDHIWTRQYFVKREQIWRQTVT